MANAEQVVAVARRVDRVHMSPIDVLPLHVDGRGNSSHWQVVEGIPLELHRSIWLHSLEHVSDHDGVRPTADGSQVHGALTESKDERISVRKQSKLVIVGEPAPGGGPRPQQISQVIVLAILGKEVRIQKEVAVVHCHRIGSIGLLLKVRNAAGILSVPNHPSRLVDNERRIPLIAGYQAKHGVARLNIARLQRDERGYVAGKGSGLKRNRINLNCSTIGTGRHYLHCVSGLGHEPEHRQLATLASYIEIRRGPRIGTIIGSVFHPNAGGIADVGAYHRAEHVVGVRLDLDVGYARLKDGGCLPPAVPSESAQQKNGKWSHDARAKKFHGSCPHVLKNWRSSHLETEGPRGKLFSLLVTRNRRENWLTGIQRL